MAPGWLPERRFDDRRAGIFDGHIHFFRDATFQSDIILFRTARRVGSHSVIHPFGDATFRPQPRLLDLFTFTCLLERNINVSSHTSDVARTSFQLSYLFSREICK